MNIAVDPDRRRHGIASTLLTRLFERVDDPDAQYTLEVRQSNAGAIALYDRFGFRSAGVRRRYYADNGEDALIMWRTPATLRGSLDDVPGRAARLDPRARDLAATTPARRSSTADGAVRASVVSSQGVHDRFGGVVPEIASRHHLELVNAVVDDALGHGRRDARRHRARRGHPGPGPGRRAARRRGHARRGSPPAGGCRSPPVDHLQGHVAANFLAPDPIEPPFLCLIASGGHTLLVRVTDHRGYEVARRDARRRRRRGVRQGRPAARPRLPRRPGAVAAGDGGRPRGVRVPDRRARRGLDFSFAGLKTALLYKVRDLGRGGDRAPRRGPRRLLRARDRRRADRAGRARARGRAGRAAGDRRRRGREPAAARARRGARRRRQDPAAASWCTDNAAMIGSAARWVDPVAVPRLPGAGRVRHEPAPRRLTPWRRATCRRAARTPRRSRAATHTRAGGC